MRKPKTANSKIKSVLVKSLKGLVLGFTICGITVGITFYSMTGSPGSAISMGSLHSLWLLPAGLAVVIVYWLPVYVTLHISQKSSYLTSCLIFVIPALIFWTLEFEILAFAVSFLGIPAALITHWLMIRDMGTPNISVNKSLNTDTSDVGAN